MEDNRVDLNESLDDTNSIIHADEPTEDKHPERFVVALTTVDNPFDPLTDFDRWFDYDMELGYSTCSYLDRIARTSNALSEPENMDEIERAIDEIIKYDFMNVYRKIKRKI